MRRRELNYLRIFLCAMIVVTHILTHYANVNELDDMQRKTLYFIRMLIIIGTPCFILLSQLLVTMNYKELPKNYLMNRIKYILLPYITIGLMYSYSESISRDISFLGQVYENLVLVQWHGYFIIVIMQFCLLNILLYKINPALLRSKLLLVIALIVNIAYLYCYQNIESVELWMDSHYPIGPDTFIGGWIGYYFAGSFIGYHYDAILQFIKQHVVLVISLSALSYVLFITLYVQDFDDVSSFNYRIVPYVLGGFLLLLHFSTMFKTFMERTAVQVSAFSFFIYLFHPIILEAVYTYTERFEQQTLIFIPITLLLVIGCCIGTGSILREFQIFKYVIGKQPYRV